MTTTKEAAKTIRTELKAQGITSRMVSVRMESYSMGSSINIEIKDPTISLSTVKAVADSHERIDRCSITGDILSGGNRFLHIGYSSEASAARAKPFVAKVEAAMAAVEGTEVVEIEGKVGISKDGSGFGFQLWNGTRAGMHVSTVECAARIVSDYIDENAVRAAADAIAEVDALVEATPAARDFDAYPALRLLA